MALVHPMGRDAALRGMMLWHLFRASEWLPHCIAGLVLVTWLGLGLLLVQQSTQALANNARVHAQAAAAHIAVALENQLMQSLSITHAADAWVAAGGRLDAFDLYGRYVGVTGLRLVAEHHDNGGRARFVRSALRDAGTGPLWFAMPAQSQAQRPDAPVAAGHNWLVALQLAPLWQAAGGASYLQGYRYELTLTDGPAGQPVALLRSPGTDGLEMPASVAVAVLDDRLVLQLMPTAGWPRGWPATPTLAVVLIASLVSFIVYYVLRQQQRAAQAALRDPLTGLPNRQLLNERATMALAQAQRAHSHVAVLFLDLDGFKTINDAYGHHRGDALLQAIGAELGKQLRKVDTLARVGGDEFVVVLADLAEASYAQGVADKLVYSATRPFDVDGVKLQVGASIGISIYPDDGSELGQLLQQSDEAMYRAKRAGGGRFVRAGQTV